MEIGWMGIWQYTWMVGYIKLTNHILSCIWHVVLCCTTGHFLFLNNIHGYSQILTNIRDTHENPTNRYLCGYEATTGVSLCSGADNRGLLPVPTLLTSLTRMHLLTAGKIFYWRHWFEAKSHLHSFLSPILVGRKQKCFTTWNLNNFTN